MNNQTTPPLATIEKRQVISSIWLLPLIALLLGGWILFQHVTHTNTEIEIHFNNADSIITDKTKIRYKGVIVGTVKRIELNATEGVNVIASIESHAAFMLRENTQFWLVSPKATLTSISGLDTVFSGSYINLQPGDGEKTDTFDALLNQPINIPDNALLINLQSDSAGSINVGTPIFFKNHFGEKLVLAIPSTRKPGLETPTRPNVDTQIGTKSVLGTSSEKKTCWSRC